MVIVIALDDNIFVTGEREIEKDRDRVRERNGKSGRNEDLYVANYRAMRQKQR